MILVALAIAFPLILLTTLERSYGAGGRLTIVLRWLPPIVAAGFLLRHLWRMVEISAIQAVALPMILAALAGWIMTLAMLSLLISGVARASVAKLIWRLRLFDSPGFDARDGLHESVLQSLLLIGMALMIHGSEFASGFTAMAYADAASMRMQLLLQSWVCALLALLGVGWLTRRDWRRACRRLGLRRPTFADLAAGITGGIALFLLAQAGFSIWLDATPADVFQSQTRAATQFAELFSAPLALSLLLTTSAAIGEELLFRGALQPVYGSIIASLAFTAFHPQYAFTPAAAILFLGSLGFCWLRSRFSTSSAIIAHALYNAIPLLIASFAPGA